MDSIDNTDDNDNVDNIDNFWIMIYLWVRRNWGKIISSDEFFLHYIWFFYGYSRSFSLKWTFSNNGIENPIVIFIVILFVIVLSISIAKYHVFKEYVSEMSFIHVVQPKLKIILKCDRLMLMLFSLDLGLGMFLKYSITPEYGHLI